jgi:hypothetical protein
MSDDADTEADEPVMDATEPTDEEQTEREWHFWLFALLLVGGGLLVVFPPGFWPDLGFAIVAGAAIGWVFKTVVEWSE